MDLKEEFAGEVAVDAAIIMIPVYVRKDKRGRVVEAVVRFRE